MHYVIREHVTKCLKAQADVLTELEAIFTETDSEVAANELIKLQHEQVNLQNRFSRLMFLSGEFPGGSIS